MNFPGELYGQILFTKLKLANLVLKDVSLRGELLNGACLLCGALSKRLSTVENLLGPYPIFSFFNSLSNSP